MDWTVLESGKAPHQKKTKKKRVKILLVVPSNLVNIYADARLASFKREQKVKNGLTWYLR